MIWKKKQKKKFKKVSVRALKIREKIICVIHFFEFKHKPPLLLSDRMIDSYIVVWIVFNKGQQESNFINIQLGKGYAIRIILLSFCSIVKVKL